jgi:hypothetical protein
VRWLITEVAGPFVAAFAFWAFMFWAACAVQT